MMSALLKVLQILTQSHQEPLHKNKNSLKLVLYKLFNHLIPVTVHTGKILLRENGTKEKAEV